MSMMEAYGTGPADAVRDVSPEPRAQHVNDDRAEDEISSGGVAAPCIDAAALDFCIKADLWP
jgi:hypothetical protein